MYTSHGYCILYYFPTALNGMYTIQGQGYKYISLAPSIYSKYIYCAWMQEQVLRMHKVRVYYSRVEFCSFSTNEQQMWEQFAGGKYLRN